MYVACAQALLEESRGESRDPMAALAQRRDRQRDAVEPEVQIVAEPLRRDLGGQIAIGRRDEPHVDLDRTDRADAQHLARLDRAEELRLRRERQLADLVEKHGAALRRLEEADLACPPRR